MKNKGFIIVGVLVFAVLTGINAKAQPGDSSDPLVSKSYVDSKINEALLRISNDDYSNTEIIPNDTVVSTFETVQGFLGQTIMGGEGSEIILRSGSSSAIVPGINGITDVTKGADLLNGYDIEKNHLLIIPRNDGRGLRVDSEQAWFLIKGEYLIIDR